MTNPTPIDSAQLARIESTHKGFLYQHLIGVACMFKIATGLGTAVVVERDEDIEIARTDGHWYIQVKNLNAPLRPGDVDPSLELFGRLREAHKTGGRSGAPKFFIVSSSEPSPHLLRDLAATSWPVDVEVVTPLRASSVLTVEVQQDVVRQWKYAVGLAQTLPFSKVTPETLTWKLTAIVQSLATGAFADGRHRATNTDIIALFEHVLALVDRLPPPPALYRLQVGEPELTSDERVRIIVGSGGSGKTSWAAQAALHAPVEIVYARAGETEGGDFAAWVASHLIANLASIDGRVFSKAFRPGAQGTEAIRIADQVVETQNRQVLMIVDDAHVLHDDVAARVVRATKRIKWLIIGRPHENLSRLADRLSVQVASLKGWSMEVIAEVMKARGVVCDPQAILRAQQVTGGAPLFVENIAHLVAVENSTLHDYLARFEVGNHARTTAMERQLQHDVVDHLPAISRRIAAALTIVRSPLPLTAIQEIARAIIGTQCADVGPSVRALIDWRVVSSIGAGGFGLHDTFRALAVQQRRGLTDQQRMDSAGAIRMALRSAIETGYGSVYHFVDYMRALGELGELDVLADLASGDEEWFREHGVNEDVEEVLASAIEGATGSPSGKFLIADSLAFIALEKKDMPRAKKWVETQEGLLKGIASPSSDFHGRLASKHLLLAKLNKDLPAAERAIKEGFVWYPKASPGGRVLRYNFALVAMECGRGDIVEKEMVALVSEYFGLLGLTPQGVFAANPPEIVQKLAPGDHRDELRHVADCLFLLGYARSTGGRQVSLEFLWAMKFYEMADAPSSALRAAVEVVDRLLWSHIAPEPQQAVHMLETSILPAMERSGLVEHMLELRSLYAVALACLGRVDDARSSLRELEPYRSGLNKQDLAVLDRRAAMVEGLASKSLRYEFGLLLDRQNQPRFISEADEK